MPERPERLLVSLAISKRGIFCQSLYRVLKTKLIKATSKDVYQES